MKTKIQYKGKKYPATNRFKTIVSISFPKDGHSLLYWFNKQNSGRPIIPLNEKVEQSHKDNAWRLHACRWVELEIEINKSGNWSLINSKIV